MCVCACMCVCVCVCMCRCVCALLVTGKHWRTFCCHVPRLREWHYPGRSRASARHWERLNQKDSIGGWFCRCLYFVQAKLPPRHICGIVVSVVYRTNSAGGLGGLVYSLYAFHIHSTHTHMRAHTDSHTCARTGTQVKHSTHTHAPSLQGKRISRR